jgi:hypothetical protein
MRFPCFLQILAVVVFLPALTTYADTLTTFDFAGTYHLGVPPDNTSGPLGSAFGTVMIDTTTGAVQAIDLSFATLSSNAVVAGTSSESYGAPLNFTELGETWLGQAGINYFAAITLDIPVATLAGYAGGNICSLDNPCANGPSIINIDIADHDFANGTLTATPEPSSLTLLAVGALAVFGITRGRLLRA